MYCFLIESTLTYQNFSCRMFKKFLIGVYLFIPVSQYCKKISHYFLFFGLINVYTDFCRNFVD